MFQVHLIPTGSDTDSRYSLIRTTPPHKRLVVITLIVSFVALGAGASFYPVEDNLWLTVHPDSSNPDCINAPLMEWKAPLFVEVGNTENLRYLRPGLEVWIFSKPGSGLAFQAKGSIARVTQLECTASNITALEIVSSHDELLQLDSMSKDRILQMRVRLGDTSLASLLVSTLRTVATG